MFHASTTPSKILRPLIKAVELANKVGICLGKSDVEVISNLEEARACLFQANNSKDKSLVVQEKVVSKVRETEGDKDIFSDEEELDEEDKELDSTARLLAGLGGGGNKFGSFGKSSSKGFVVGRNRANVPIKFNI